MPSSFARCATTSDVRPERIPTRSPARWASIAPRPSRTWNALASPPPGRNITVPSVITPSTSVSTRRKRRHRAARASSFTLDHLRLPQVMELDDPVGLALGVHDDERGDLARLHQVQRGGGQLAAADQDRARGHALLGGAVEQAVAVPLHLPPEVAVGEDPAELPPR